MGDVDDPIPSYNASEFDEWFPPDPGPRERALDRVPFHVPSMIRDGARNTTLYRSARSLHAKGFSLAAIRAALTAENAERCDPPLAVEEVDALAAHAATQPDRSDFAETASSASPALPSHWQRLDLADLDKWPDDPLVPIVDGWFARRSLVYVAAETQTGKTLLFQNVLWRCVHGGRLFEKYAVTPVERVAYLVLEDPARRIRERFLDMVKEFPDPIAQDRCVLHIAPGFTLTEERFWQWLEHIIVDERRDVVIIDTYQKATPGIESFDDKAQGPILHRLAELPRRFPVTIIVIDHIRKQPNTGRRREEVAIDDIKGSGGKAQNADAVILLARTPDRKQLKVQVFGKDYDEPVRILLRVAPKGSAGPKFTYVSDLAGLGDSRQTRAERRRRTVLEAVPFEWTTSTIIATHTNVSESTVQRDLKALMAERQVEDNGASRQWRRYRRISQSVTAPANLTDSQE